MRTLTSEDKSQLKCEVSIFLCYEDCDEVKERFDSLCKYLHSAHLITNINKIKRFGSSLELTCRGLISLLDAEYILSKDNEYVLPLEIVYWDGIFMLKNRSY